MTSLAIIAPGLPPLSFDLAEAMADARRNATYQGPALPLTVPERVKRDAARRADLLEDTLEPAGGKRVHAWLLELAKVKAFTPKDLDGAVSLMARFLQDLPAFCFTGRTLEGAAAAFKAWPDYAELKIHLGTIARPVRDEIAALRLVQAAPEPDSAKPAPDRPDPAHVRAQVEALKRDLAAARPVSNREPAKAVRLNHAQLAAAYREQIAQGRDPFGLAATRLRALERTQADEIEAEMTTSPRVLAAAQGREMERGVGA